MESAAHCLWPRDRHQTPPRLGARPQPMRCFMSPTTSTTCPVSFRLPFAIGLGMKEASHPWISIIIPSLEVAIRGCQGQWGPASIVQRLQLRTLTEQQQGALRIVYHLSPTRKVRNPKKSTCIPYVLSLRRPKMIQNGFPSSGCCTCQRRPALAGNRF